MQLYTAHRKHTRTGDPAVLFGALIENQTDVVLLESKDGNGRNNVRSLLFVQNALRAECRGRCVSLEPLSDNGRRALDAITTGLKQVGTCQTTPAGLTVTFPESWRCGDDAARIRATSPSDIIRLMTLGWTTEANAQRRVVTPGVFAYDHLEQHEELPAATRDIHRFPDYVFYLPEVLITIDHEQNSTSLTIYEYRTNKDESHRLETEETAERFNRKLAELFDKAPEELPVRATSRGICEAAVDLTDAEYGTLVSTLKEHINCGDVFQIVPSRTFSVACENPLATYQILRRLNPSPYLFYVQNTQFTLLGSSPETSVRVTGSPKEISIHPIAGTRARGYLPDGTFDHDLDSRLEAELKLNHKEVAEHIMLVDLARNDVARISKPGTRQTTQLMEVERYSHVMHLVSVVKGELKEDLDGLHAYLASSNMGTLVGTPKIEAAKLLRRHEVDKRGPYGGAVGYFASDGEMDTAIVIRAALVREGTAYVRAGAGIVFDSDPMAEAAETRAKSQAVLRAIELAKEAVS